MADWGGPLVIVDIETNGLSYTRGKIIEIAAIRIEDGEVVREFQSLLNPEAPLTTYISSLTGIAPEELEGAPTFGALSEELLEIMDGAVFVAHNVRFDYAFIKQEFKRIGRRFTPKMACSVRLSKALNPQHRRHSLGEIINRYGLPVAARHRAYDDALAVWQFLQLQQREHGMEAVQAALGLQLKRQSLPSHLDEKVIARLPDGPGVYVFEDEQGSPLYIGKSVHIRKRVLSHFAQDHAVDKELKLSQLVRNITAHPTNGELEALLLESQMVKEMHPVYNHQLRRVRQLTLALHGSNEAGYSTVSFAETQEIVPEQIGTILGAFTSRSKARQRLEAVQKVFDLCPKLLGIEKGKGACFLSQLGRCRGACAGKEKSELYNRRLHVAFETLRIHEWPYRAPILIQEKSEDAAHQTGIVVDQWCVIAHMAHEEFGETVMKPIKRRFDLDMYRILRSFVADKSNRLKITTLQPVQLDLLLETAR